MSEIISSKKNPAAPNVIPSSNAGISQVQENLNSTSLAASWPTSPHADCLAFPASSSPSPLTWLWEAIRWVFVVLFTSSIFMVTATLQIMWCTNFRTRLRGRKWILYVGLFLTAAIGAQTQNTGKSVSMCVTRENRRKWYCEAPPT